LHVEKRVTVVDSADTDDDDDGAAVEGREELVYLLSASNLATTLAHAAQFFFDTLFDFLHFYRTSAHQAKLSQHRHTKPMITRDEKPEI
jgi:hypothetical protein